MVAEPPPPTTTGEAAAVRDRPGQSHAGGYPPRAGIIPAETRKQASESFAQEPDYTLLASWMVNYLGSVASKEPE